VTIDERLERLTERTEALTQSVELLASMHKDNEQRMAVLAESMTKLADAVLNHEHRLDDLEDQQ
jgi:predicted nuclease with TOPRIM domain